MDQVMKSTESVIAQSIRVRVSLDEMQFRFVPERSITSIFLLRHLQEKLLAKDKPLYVASLDMEKAFGRIF